MPPASLATLPIELFTQVTNLLSHHDLAQLLVTCKSLNAAIEPLIWDSIEFHEDGYHDSTSELNVPPPFIPISQRNYCTDSGTKSWEHQSRYKAQAWFNMLQDLHATDQNRLRVVCSRVKNLCSRVDPSWGRRDGKDEVIIWQLLPFFTNLETLEIHSSHLYVPLLYEPVDEINGPPLPHLQFVKLFDYVPREVARWVLKSGPTLERLELGLLDRPISSVLCRKRLYKPIPAEKLNPSMDGESDSDAKSDYGSLDGEAVIPRPLGGFLEENKGPDLPQLKVLFLFSTADHPSTSVVNYGWSTRAERAMLADWRRLLLACNKTVEILVLEQRVGAAYIEGDGATEEDYVGLNCDGSSNEQTVRMLEEILADKEAFPALKKVYLYGFGVYEDFEHRPREKGSGGRLMLQLQRRDVRCEARRGKWCYFDDDQGSPTWGDWEGEFDTENEDYLDENGEDVRDLWDTVLATV